MTHAAPTILLADIDERTRAFVAAQLAVDGYDVLEAALPAQVRARAVTRPVALLVLGDFEELGESLALLREFRAGHACTASSIPACRSSWSATTAASSACFAASTPAPTTTWPSRSATPSFAPGSPRSCAARRSA